MGTEPTGGLHDERHDENHDENHCDALRRRLVELEAEPGNEERCEEVRDELRGCCPSCADTVAADELFRRMMSRSCVEHAPEHLRSKVDRWMQETCFRSQTTVVDSGATRIVYEESSSTTVLRQDPRGPGRA